jgi:hypothetical protein
MIGDERGADMARSRQASNRSHKLLIAAFGAIPHRDVRSRPDERFNLLARSELAAGSC